MSFTRLISFIAAAIFFTVVIYGNIVRGQVRIPGPGGASIVPIALIANTGAGSSDGNNVTTSGINTTGSTLLVASVGYLVGTTPSVTDSKTACASWTGLTAQASNSTTANRLFYCANPASVGSGHTVTASTSAGFPSACVASFSNVITSSPFDQQNGASGESSTTLATGSITPGTSNQVVISGSVIISSTTAMTVDSSMSITNTVLDSGGLHFGCSLAYIVQTTASAINATWTSHVSANNMAVTIASFKHN